MEFPYVSCRLLFDSSSATCAFGTNVLAALILGIIDLISKAIFYRLDW